MQASKQSTAKVSCHKVVGTGVVGQLHATTSLGMQIISDCNQQALQFKGQQPVNTDVPIDTTTIVLHKLLLCWDACSNTGALAIMLETDPELAPN